MVEDKCFDTAKKLLRDILDSEIEGLTGSIYVVKEEIDKDLIKRVQTFIKAKQPC